MFGISCCPNQSLTSIDWSSRPSRASEPTSPARSYTSWAQPRTTRPHGYSWRSTETKRPSTITTPSRTSGASSKREDRCSQTCVSSSCPTATASCRPLTGPTKAVPGCHRTSDDKCHVLILTSTTTRSPSSIPNHHRAAGDADRPTPPRAGRAACGPECECRSCPGAGWFSRRQSVRPRCRSGSVGCRAPRSGARCLCRRAGSRVRCGCASPT